MAGNARFMAGLLVGAAAGAALTLLFTTDQGKEFVDDLRAAAGKAEEELKDVADRFEEGLSAIVEKGKEYAENLRQQVKDFAAENNV